MTLDFHHMTLHSSMVLNSGGVACAGSSGNMINFNAVGQNSTRMLYYY